MIFKCHNERENIENESRICIKVIGMIYFSLFSVWFVRRIKKQPLTVSIVKGIIIEQKWYLPWRNGKEKEGEKAVRLRFKHNDKHLLRVLHGLLKHQFVEASVLKGPTSVT